MNDIIKSRSLERILQRHQITPEDQATPPVILDALGEAYDTGLLRGRHHHPMYTRIDLMGERDHYAKLVRKIGTQWINMEVITPNLDLESAVPTDNPAEQWIAARHVRDELEVCKAGYAGIEAYYQAFRHMADPGGGYQI